LTQRQENHLYLIIVKVIFSCGKFAIAIDYGKGGLISGTFSLSLKSPQKGAKNYPLHYPSKKNVQDSDLALFLLKT
jgi:hypothetical protein